MDEFELLDQAWEQINALGGTCTAAEADVREHARHEGYSDALTEALQIIENMGGMDPCQRRGLK